MSVTAFSAAMVAASVAANNATIRQQHCETVVQH